MRTPVFVRPLADSERDALTSGLRSPAAFTLRRCQILLASARGARAPQIAAHLGCDDQTVRDAIHAFNWSGLDALLEGSSRPHRIAVAFDPVAADRLRARLHQSPRAFGKPTGLWTLALAAAVCCAEGIIDERVTGETIRVTLNRLGVRWQRARQWITSPDPAYRRKKGGRVPSGCG
jgi:transposase